VNVLGIETSCDETAVAIVSDQRTVRANLIASQVDLHRRFGGVVPEVASRAHAELLTPLLDEAVERAGMRFSDLDAVAVTVGPGLVGALLVGIAAAKAIALATGIPLIGVNHLEGHVYANFLDGEPPQPPYVCLIVSGGHTLLAHMSGEHAYEILGQTLDDAAGEAFDKIARFLGLEYPGGPALDRAARRGKPDAVRFPRALEGKGYDFSLSGLKTAVIRHVKKEREAGREPRVEDVAASFQEAVVDVQVSKTIAAARERGAGRILLGGGVVANSRLRQRMSEAAAAARIEMAVPPPELCTDNAAMIAGAGASRLLRGESTSLEVNASASLPLDAPIGGMSMAPSGVSP
jgi:N6-L-threonylcarbamoyladenine synthase